MNLSILICQELWQTPLYSYLISSSEQLCKVSSTVPILQIKKQVSESLSWCAQDPPSTILKIAKTWLWTSALKVHTSLLPYPIFNISIRHVPPLGVACMLLCFVQLKKTKSQLDCTAQGKHNQNWREDKCLSGKYYYVVRDPGETYHPRSTTAVPWKMDGSDSM